MALPWRTRPLDRAAFLVWHDDEPSSEKKKCMQTDTWLTDTSHTDCCPLCSQPLAAGSNICPACGFVAHEPAHDPASPTRSFASRQAHPITPIPARASALRAQNASGRLPSRSASTPAAGSSSASSPEQTTGWQHTSSSYEAASSLSSLSLIIAETPTAPPRTTRRLPRQTERLEHIDEIDTLPPASAGMQEASDDCSELPTAPGSPELRFDETEAPNLALILAETTPPISLAHIDEIDTVPETGRPSASALRDVAPASRAMAVDAASWTARPGSSDSLAARLIASRAPRRRRYPRGFNPLDRARWWLLRPGHIEFLLWLVGSILLFGITFFLLLAIVLSAMLPARGNFPTSAMNSYGVSTPMANTDPRLELPGKAAFTTGAELHLQGQGFRPRSQVVFLLDGRWPLLDQRGQPASVQADASGHFVVNLWLGQGANWSAGSHKLLARETDNGHQALIPITITASSATPAQSNPASSSTPAQPTYPTAPPARPTPTPTHTTSTPTPASTPGSSPTASPGATGTPLGSATASATKAAGSSSLGNDLNGENSDSLLARLSHLNPLIWFITCCYLLSMLFMGLAGVLRRRRH